MHHNTQAIALSVHAQACPPSNPLVTYPIYRPITGTNSLTMAFPSRAPALKHKRAASIANESLLQHSPPVRCRSSQHPTWASTSTNLVPCAKCRSWWRFCTALAPRQPCVTQDLNVLGCSWHEECWPASKPPPHLIRLNATAFFAHWLAIAICGGNFAVWWFIDRRWKMDGRKSAACSPEILCCVFVPGGGRGEWLAGAAVGPGTANCSGRLQEFGCA